MADKLTPLDEFLAKDAAFKADYDGAVPQSVKNCSHWQIVWHVHLPNLRTAMAVTAILTFVFAWNELALALMPTEVSMKTVPVAIIGMIQPDDIPWGQISAGSTIMLIPMVIVVFALQKHIVSGLTLGVVK